MALCLSGTFWGEQEYNSYCVRGKETVEGRREAVRGRRKIRWQRGRWKTGRRKEWGRRERERKKLRRHEGQRLAGVAGEGRVWQESTTQQPETPGSPTKLTFSAGVYSLTTLARVTWLAGMKESPWLTWLLGSCPSMGAEVTRTQLRHKVRGGMCHCGSRI